MTEIRYCSKKYIVLKTELVNLRDIKRPQTFPNVLRRKEAEIKIFIFDSSLIKRSDMNTVFHLKWRIYSDRSRNTYPIMKLILVINSIISIINHWFQCDDCKKNSFNRVKTYFLHSMLIQAHIPRHWCSFNLAIITHLSVLKCYPYLYIVSQRSILATLIRSMFINLLSFDK